MSLVSKVKAEKKVLEEQIRKLLSDFEEEHKVKVSDISYAKCEVKIADQTVISSSECKIKIEIL